MMNEWLVTSRPSFSRRVTGGVTPARQCQRIAALFVDAHIRPVSLKEGG